MRSMGLSEREGNILPRRKLVTQTTTPVLTPIENLKDGLKESERLRYLGIAQRH